MEIKTRAKRGGKIPKKQVETSIIWNEKHIPDYLDDQQRAAVKTQKNKVMVVAAAGSGKTRVITERVNYLINCGVKPENIVCITFTNMATEEMRERLQANPKVGSAFIGTIHSFANKVMKTTGERYELFSAEIDILFHKKLITKYCKFLTFEKWAKFKDLLDEEMLGKVPQGFAEEFLIFSEKAELKLIERPLGQEDKDYPETVATMCYKQKVITFEELLKRATVYFENTNSFPEYVLVDEFQDVGDLEYKFVMSLNAKNYFFVGDDYQSIYGWKGGNVEIFKTLCQNKEWCSYKLENNYRNGKLILDLAAKIIEQVPGRIPKTVNVKSEVNAQFTIDTKHKLGAVLEIIKGQAEKKDWFVLVRKNADLSIILNELEKRKVPAITFKREGVSLAEMRMMMEMEAVKVLTVHTAKGLESRNVLVYGEGFKIKRPDWMKNDEETRVMYVAVTRAKENLIILN